MENFIFCAVTYLYYWTLARLYTSELYSQYLNVNFFNQSPKSFVHIDYD